MPPPSRPHAFSPLAPLVTMALVALLSALPAACGDDALTSSIDRADGAPPAGAAHADTVRVDSARRDSTRRDSTVTPAGAVAAIVIQSRQLTLPAGRSAALRVTGVDAKGVPSLALLARPAFSIADGAVAAVNDTGIVIGRAPGSTEVYARVGAWVDSAVVTVVRDTSSAPAAVGPGFRILLRSVTAFTGRTQSVGAALYDVAGRVVRAPGKQATWRVGDERVARLGAPSSASDTAFLVPVTGVAPGATKPYATLDGVTDSVPLAVVTARDSGATTPPRAPAAGAALLEGRADFGPPQQATMRVGIVLPAKR